VKVVTTAKIYTWTCPRCGKALTSLWPEQLRNNARNHLIGKHDMPLEEVEKEIEKIGE
jgi:hypothetical protein